LNHPPFTLVHTTSLPPVEPAGYGSEAADLADADLSAGSCSGVGEGFERLDEYVDLELAGADRRPPPPGMREPLQGCPRVP